MNRQQGFIGVIAMMVIALLITIITLMINKRFVYGPFAQTTIERTKARELALGGIQVALSQLSKAAEATGKEKEKKEPTADDQAKELLKTIVPVLNRWQTFDLKKNNDGVDGQLNICITCEDGKIDLNALYDFKKKQFIKMSDGSDGRKVAQYIFEQLGKNLGSKELFPGFEKFLKDRQYSIQDVTELLTIKEFEIFKNKLFYDPTEPDKKTSEKPPVYLTDIFTVWSGSPSLQPWMLSDSVSTLLGLTRISQTKAVTKERMDQMLKTFKNPAEWPTDWNSSVASLYTKKFAALPKELIPLWKNEFEPTMFCVLSYAKIGTLSQRVLAIVQRGASLKKESDAFEVKIRKLYWL